MKRLLIPLLFLALGVRAEEASPALPVGAGEDALGLLASLVLMVILLAAAWWFLRRLRAAQSPALGGVAVVSQLPLGVKEKLVVVQVGSQRLLLGCTPASMQTLHCWAAEPGEAAAESGTGTDFAALLKHKLGPLQRGERDAG